jgi:hypothetical protein
MLPSAIAPSVLCDVISVVAEIMVSVRLHVSNQLFLHCAFSVVVESRRGLVRLTTTPTMMFDQRIGACSKESVHEIKSNPQAPPIIVPKTSNVHCFPGFDRTQ